MSHNGILIEDDHDFNRIFEEGRQNFHFGDINESFKQFTEGTKRKPENAAVWFRLGLSCALKGEIEESMKILEAALSRDQNNPSILETLGHLYMITNRFEEMEKVFNEVLKIKSDRGVLLYHFSSTLFLLMRFSEAEKYAREAIKLMPYHEDTWLVLGAALIRQGKRSEGEKALDEIRFLKKPKSENEILEYINTPQEHLIPIIKERKNHPLDSDMKQLVLQQIGLHLRELELEDYLDRVSETLSKEPVKAEEWKRRGMLLMNLYRYRDAELAFRKYMELESDHHTYIFLVSALSSQLRYEDAVNVIKPVYEANPDDKAVMFAYYGTLCKAALFSEADKILSRVTESDPYSAHMFRSAFEQHRKEAEFEGINIPPEKIKIERLATSKPLDSSQKNLHLEKITIPRYERCWLRLIGHSEKIHSGAQITLSVDSKEVWSDDVFQSFRQLIEIDKIDSGKSDIEIDMEFFEGSWFITLECVYEPLMKEKETTKGTEKKTIQLLKVADDHPTMKSGEFWHEYGRTMMHLGKFELAKESLLRSTKIKPDDPIAWTNLGIVYALLSELKEAEKAFQRALVENPEERYSLIMLGLFAIGNNLIDIIQTLVTNQKFRDHRFVNVLHWFSCGYLFNYEFQEAEAIARETIALNPNYTETWAVLSCSLYRQDRQEEASRAFQRVKALYSNAIHFDLGKLAEMVQLNDEGKPKFVKPPKEYADLVKAMNPDFLALDIREDAIRMLGPPVFNLPKNNELWSLRGATFRTVRRFAEAEQSFNKALEQNPEEPTPVDFVLGLPENLKAMFEQKVKPLAGRARILTERWILLLQDGRQIEASTALLVVDQSAPGTFFQWRDLGVVIDAKTGEVKKKPEKLVKKEQKKPPREPKPDPAILKDVSKIDKFDETLKYANSLLNQGYYEEAEKGFRRAIEIDEKNSEAWRGLSVSLMNQRRYYEGVDARRKAESLE